MLVVTEHDFNKGGSRPFDLDMQRELTSQIQFGLNTKGYKLEHDGIFGRGTLAAFNDWQADCGLTVTDYAPSHHIFKLLGKARYGVFEELAPIVTNVDTDKGFDFLLQATSYLGTMEKGKNTDNGGPIDTFLEHAGRSPGDPWCAAFISYLGRDMGFPKSAYVPHFIDTAKWDTLYLLKIKNIRRELGVRLVLQLPIVAGTLFTLYYPSLGRDGHIGIIVGMEDGYLKTLEGNTNAAGGREGVTVAYKKRRIEQISHLIKWVV